jgi:hypothetical protein
MSGMSTVLIRKWDSVSKTHIYTDCDGCEYTECHDDSNPKKFGVKCDGTFYERCWNPSLDPKNWQVTVPCCTEYVINACCYNPDNGNTNKYIRLEWSGWSTPAFCNASLILEYNDVGGWWYCYYDGTYGYRYFVKCPSYSGGIWRYIAYAWRLTQSESVACLPGFGIPGFSLWCGSSSGQIIPITPDGDGNKCVDASSTVSGKTATVTML